MHFQARSARSDRPTAVTVAPAEPILPPVLTNRVREISFVYGPANGRSVAFMIDEAQ